MTVERLNEIATRTNQIRIECRMHEVDSVKLAEELLDLSDELTNVDINYTYFWLMQSLLTDVHSVIDELLHK